ncbi:hypothetical protein ACIRPQ_28330 [Streptomyces sp. NPDC101213]|uniref:hypothetical protein n=1 Tax=Streptomyces sp. NPDC101213 TaxID=3366130 RepID=UPI00382A1453
MNVKRNVVPRDIGDSPLCLALALLFWGLTALIVWGPLVLLPVFSVAWGQSPRWMLPWLEVTLLQIGIGAAVLTPLYFAPGAERLAPSARFALLGPVAMAVALTVPFCVDLPGT